MSQVAKWGFGMAPLKEQTNRENIKSITSVMDFVKGGSRGINEGFLDDISRVKGLFNRILRQDQWDWFTVNMYFDYPANRDIKVIVNALTDLRKAVLTKDDAMGKRSLKLLTDRNFVMYCYNYLAFDINVESPEEYLYILSRRENKDILKIGRTVRNITKRVNEINSATGVLYPYSARAIFKVKDSQIAEKAVHNLLSNYRIRNDREFFELNYKEACKIIEEFLIKRNMFYYDDCEQ